MGLLLMTQMQLCGATTWVPMATTSWLNLHSPQTPAQTREIVTQPKGLETPYVRMRWHEQGSRALAPYRDRLGHPPLDGSQPGHQQRYCGMRPSKQVIAACTSLSRPTEPWHRSTSALCSTERQTAWLKRIVPTNRMVHTLAFAKNVAKVSCRCSKHANGPDRDGGPVSGGGRERQPGKRRVTKSMRFQSTTGKRRGW